MAVWLRTVEGERFKLAKRTDETDDQIMRALLDGTVGGWVPVVRGDGDWMLLNLRHVLRIETGGDDGPHVGFA